jgi:hypothetical protein
MFRFLPAILYFRVFKESLKDFFGGKKKEEEEEIRMITSGKYIPKRRVVHLGLYIVRL